MVDNFIKVRGARVHNLKNVDLDIPKNKLVVFSGVSGSGKSSLAFDTIYAEGQRRYVESLSTYARQFLGVMEKPDVDLIEGLSPAISIDQKTTSRNPRSTVGTVTEIYDYLRLLFARIGHPHCPICGREIATQSVDQIVDGFLEIIKQGTGKTIRFLVLAPLVVDKKGEFTSLFDNLKAKGFSYVRIDKVIKALSEDFYLLKNNKHTIEVVIDRISIENSALKHKDSLASFRSRITESAEQALELSNGLVVLSKITDQSFDLPEYPKKMEDHLFSERFACPIDNIQISEIEPRTFSFNSPHGACEVCSGLGSILKVEPYLVFSDELTITEGAILPFPTMFEYDTWFSRLVLEVCRQNGINPRTRVKNLSESQKRILIDGTGSQVYRVLGKNKQGKETAIVEAYPGIAAELERRFREASSDYAKADIEKYMKSVVCPSCNGSRLKKEALAVTVSGKSIAEVTVLSVTHCLEFIDSLMKQISDREAEIGKLITAEIATRLKFLADVGLEYLTLDRTAGSLSGGEAQRIRLASQIGSGLTGVLYVLDEPTIGLHQKDNRKLIETLKGLRNMGNTVIVVEHDREMIDEADYLVDFGPKAGKFGGAVVSKGLPSQVSQDVNSVTGKYLSGAKKIIINRNISLFDSTNRNFHEITLSGASQFNLKNIDVVFPLGKLTAITGVSGSGKSTLLVDTLYPALMQKLNPFYKTTPGAFKNLTGIEEIDKVILIDQSPIGRTPRSNPATYTKLFDPIRDLYSSLKDSKVLGFKKGRFSFNVKGGRCENCQGQGQLKIEMQFMGDIWVDCEVCRGTRYNSQTLEVDYRGKNIAEVLKLTVGEAREFFSTYHNITSKLDTLVDVGLSYIELGQPATTLSGGEAQRIKLSSELARKDTGNTVYILDEPTTGLHFADLEKLLGVLRVLVDRGNTVLLIEHNLDVIKNADWIIDLGPEGGDGGGYIVAQGTPSDIKKNKASITAAYLNE